MSKYLALQRRIDQMKKDEKGSVAPIIGYINKVNESYEVIISLCDGKQNYSTSKQRTSITRTCTSFDEAENYILDYLKNNKPMDNFILFTNEEDLLI